MSKVHAARRFENSTRWPDHFLRRMAAWCCRELDIPVRLVRHYRFRNSRSSWGGVARYWKRQVSVCVGAAHHFPASCSTHREGERFADQVECLVAVTAHEIYHVAAHLTDDHRQRTRGFGRGSGSSERVTCDAEFKALHAFREQREFLLASWYEEEPIGEKPKPDAVTLKIGKVRDRLAIWQRKQKYAANKIRKYTRQLKYYERRAAACPSA